MKIYIETYGCAANQYDSDLIREKYSGEFVDNAKEADLIIVNTCGVKSSTENKILARLERLKGKKVIIAGCLPKMIRAKLKRMFPDFELMDSVKLEPKILNFVKEVQPIVVSRGCLGACTYCATKNARGNLHSYPIKNVVERVKDAVKKGAKKILLTSEDMSCYGKDIGVNLADLLKEIVKIPGDFEVRVGMMNPTFALEFLDDLVKVFKNEKIIKFLHIPVQSGNDVVLKRMNRAYAVEDFEKIVDYFRNEIPEIIISTDIICGFPGETEKQFEDSLNLIKKVEPEVLNISKFYPRPGTPAKNMKQLSTRTIKERSIRMSKLFKELRKI